MRLPIALVLGAVLALASVLGGCGGSGRDPGCSPACGAGEVCVVLYDGQCNQLGHGYCVASSCGLECDTTPGGPNGPCTVELCGLANQDGGSHGLFTCGVPCGTEPPGTFACYGP